MNLERVCAVVLLSWAVAVAGLNTVYTFGENTYFQLGRAGDQISPAAINYANVASEPIISMKGGWEFTMLLSGTTARFLFPAHQVYSKREIIFLRR